MKITIRIPKQLEEIKRGVTKYAAIASSTGEGVYFVVKLRRRVQGKFRYVYKCTCPDHTFRQKTCKHMKLFKSEE